MQTVKPTRNKRTRKVFTTVLISLLALAIPLQAFAQDEQPAQSFDGLVERIHNLSETHDAPAFALAVIEGGKLSGTHVEGKADRDANIDATANTLFRIGSISKMFVGLAALKLEQEGLLDMNTEVRSLAPEIPFENQWEATDPVRFIHLLEHTTGWDDMHMRAYSYEARDNLTLEEGLNLFPESRVTRWVPGTREAYCNSGPAVAAFIIEKITGVPFEEYVQQHFFMPIGMPTTTFFKPQPYDNAAKVYHSGKHQPYWSLTVRPSGSVNSSLTEMTHFLSFLMNKGRVDNRQILPAHLFDKMEMPHSTLGARQGIEAGYGITNMLDGYKGATMNGHGGAVAGGMAFVGSFRELDAGFVLLMTGDGLAFHHSLEQIKKYLTRELTFPTDWSEAAKAYPLPDKFKALDGWYRPINSRTKRMDLMLHLLGAQKIWHEANVVHRSPLLEGWVSNEIAYDKHVLTDAWTNLPSLALTNDPIAGETVQVAGNLYQKTSALNVFGLLALVMFTVLFSVIGLLYALCWVPYRYVKKQFHKPSTALLIWPTLSSLSLVLFLILPIFVGVNFELLAKVNAITLGILMTSVLFPLFTLVACVRQYQLRNSPASKVLYWFVCVVIALHVFMSIYLACFDFVFLRTWLT
ncbi:serine hydrolase domain-containing protein [Saccharophagus degradans]|uniref:Serine hydrolase n=1 Tax=Saccharophagus degradans TaxID=86304 RepID=A0AAW7X1W7_9GAMM|nr:serine hydrolase [Saccharophagus degradans]MDO6421623.1 serine hydrolase [Saccharophagus degradans]MDO6608585.1 serine hydrolase [Saccharophagus degradans]